MELLNSAGPCLDPQDTLPVSDWPPDGDLMLLIYSLSLAVQLVFSPVMVYMSAPSFSVSS